MGVTHNGGKTEFVDRGKGDVLSPNREILVTVVRGVVEQNRDCAQFAIKVKLC